MGAIDQVDHLLSHFLTKDLTVDMKEEIIEARQTASSPLLGKKHPLGLFRLPNGEILDSNLIVGKKTYIHY